MKASYNSIGQLVAEKWYDSSDTLTAHYIFVHDGEGNIVRSIDVINLKEYNYSYEDGRLIRSTECTVTLNSNELVTKKNLVNSILYYYDNEGELTKKRIIPASGTEQVIYYETPDNENTVVKFTAGGKLVTSHSKTDSFGRKVFDELQLGTGFVSRQFDYHLGEISDTHSENGKLKSTPTTQLISRITMSDGRTLDYEYDAEERITKVTDTYYIISGTGTIEEKTDTIVYTYDALGQLLSETVNGTAVNSMTYDNYGNIRTKNGVTYTYDTVWKDKLTKVGTKTITYDAQGNPTSYLGNTLTWEKGRQLKQFTKTDGTAVSYTYNANGIRTSKTVNGVTHTYTLDGTQILSETWGENTLIPLYDNEDEVCGIIYNNTPYYFFKNQQGDVVEIVDKDAGVVARYTYDAWGKVIAVRNVAGAYITGTTNIAYINPYRYRSYYYDEETKLYYLQSRYYDAEVGRFVSSDVPEWSTIIGKQAESNLYAYCKSEPVNDRDILGNAGMSTIIDFVAQVLDLIVNTVKSTVGMSEEMANLKKMIKRAKSKGASKEWIKELKGRKKNMVKDAKLGVKKISDLANKLSWLAIAISLVPSIKAIENGVKALAELFVDVILTVLGVILDKLLEVICRLLPGLGFMLGWAMCYLLDMLLDKFEKSKYIKKLKKDFSKRVKYSDTFSSWMSKFGTSIKKCT